MRQEDELTLCWARRLRYGFLPSTSEGRMPIGRPKSS